VNIPDEYVPRILTAIEHYGAYLKATQRDERLYEEVLNFLNRKAPTKEELSRPITKKRA
jgi:hypothetical protein